MSISSSAVLARLNISVWTANKLDKTATANVIASNGATDRAAQVHKNLMAGTHLRKDIADYAAECRLWHNTWTLGWEDRGSRLLPTSLFMDYKAQANVRRAAFTGMVDKFCDNYDGHVQIARNYLVGLFDSSDYPTVDEVRSKFGFQLVFNPVPESGHFLLDIPAQELEETKRSCEQEIDARLKEAMRGSWEKLHTMLTGMSEKLTEVDEDTKKRWHDSFVTNAQDMCRMLTHLNITKDPDLEAARRALERVMVGADIDTIKDNPMVRESMKTKVDSILKQFEW
jgi:hypothetical protein